MSVNQWHNETLGQKVVEALRKNNFDAVYFDNKEDAVEHVLKFISPGMKVGMGGSMTLKELDILSKIEAKVSSDSKP